MNQKPKQLLRIPMKYVRDIQLGTIMGANAINLIFNSGKELGPMTLVDFDDLLSDLQAIKRTYLS